MGSPAPILKPLEGASVLVVEDDDDLRTLMTAVFELCGAHVVAAESARAGLRAFERSHPHVIISDIAMPGEDGYWLIEQIRRKAPEQGGGIPAVAVTAYSQHYDRQRTLSSGFQAYLPKPVDPQELCRVTAELIGA